MKVSAALSLAAHSATPLVRKPASLSFVLGPPGPALVRFALVCASVPCFVYFLFTMAMVALGVNISGSALGI